MEPQLTITKENGGVRLETTYQLDMNGEVTLSIHVPLVNPSMLTLQAVACDQAAAGLTKWAQQLRSQIQSHPAT